MRRVVLVALIASLWIGTETFADERAGASDAAERARLADAKQRYEEMLRDAKTETAAKYFVDRIGRIEDQLRALAPKPRRKAGTPPPTPLAARGISWLRSQIRAKLKAEKDAGITDMTAWTRRELPEAFFAAIRGWSGDGSPGRAREVWEKRQRNAWHAASYRSGTFIVRPSGPKPTRRAPLGRDTADGAVRVVPPKPPTRDQWWARAHGRVRAEWLLAFFVEQSGLFEVAENEKLKPCEVCSGDGQQSKMLSTGKRATYLCTRCAGARHDVTIRFR